MPSLQLIWHVVSENALDPILSTELGIVIEVRPEHLAKALSPIIVTELGMVTEVKPRHPEKA